MAVKASDKDRWNLLSPASPASPASKSLAKDFDFGDAAKGGLVKGKDRWNLLRDNVQSVSLQARGVNAFSSVGRPVSSPSQRIQLFSSTLRRAAARQDKSDEVLESPGATSVLSVLTAPEPAPEPGVAGDAECPANLSQDLKGKAGQDDFGEEFSDWESEVSKSANLETLEPNDLQGFLGHSDDVTSPGMAIAHGSVTGARREASRQEQLGEVPDAEVDPSHFIVGNSESAEIHASASVASSATASGAPNGAAEAPATDLMARMLGGLPSWATFSGADESEDEVHNAWGEQDTEEMMGQRALELQQARGIEIPGTPTESAAQARLAKRRQKAQAKQKVHLEVNSAESTESTAGNLFGMMSMLSGLANATASSAHGDDKEEVHNAWGGDDTDSNFAERAAELEQARGMVVPVLQVQTTGRERLAKRRQKGQKAQKQLKSCEGHSEVSDEGLATYSGPVTASVFSAAATGMVQFQRLFNLVTSNEEDEIDEVFCIWGEEDSPEKHQERVVALEMARSDQSARLPHHRVLRQKRRGPASPSNKEPDDPFLLELREQIE
ncbi:unnamed protein product [Symbiodinium natans]|uniref:Uncharacterized protein n=1 Tax=Symbiodinium natans TaxID=878477 RepID=A0A812V985_9DINO|nr:unnamed protein product [Symbiodinium natans]